MTNDLADTADRLRVCMQAAAATVPDEAPPWDAAPGVALLAAIGPRRRWAARLGVAVAIGVAAAVFAFAVARRPATTGSRVRSLMIAAAQRAVDARSARLQVTSAPVGGPVLVATGVVDFVTPAYTATYPDGFSWVVIGDQTWTTVWPPVNGKFTWVQRPLSRGPRPNAKEATLAAALEPDTAPDALVRALRSDTPSFADLGVANTGGVAAHHYQATQTTPGTNTIAWEADVWINNGLLVRVAVQAPTGSVTFDYSDYSLPVTSDRTAPTDVLRQPRSRYQPSPMRPHGQWLACGRERHRTSKT
jgi:hypothetical protein